MNRIRLERARAQTAPIGYLSTENAILLAGAVGVAFAVITAITVYVKSHMP